MALSKPKSATPAAAKTTTPGTFEDETSGGTAVAEQPAPPAPKADDVAQAKAGVAASHAVAKIAAGSLAQAIKTESLAGLKDAIPSVSFGTFPRLIGSNGSVRDKDAGNLGEWADIQLLSWSETYVVSPGEDTEEAKAAVRYSRDGVTIDETGEDVNAYLKKLRETDGYEDAAKKMYIELIGFLHNSQKPVSYNGELVQVSLSPQSLKSFEAYRANVAVRVRLSQITAEGIENLRISAEVKQKGSKDFTLLKVTGQPKKA